MKKSQIILFFTLIGILLASCMIPVSAATPPDIIHQIKVTMIPQPDGSMNILYHLDYEATTDFPEDIQYLEVGVANDDFSILDYGPDSLISGVRENKGGSSQVHLDFKKLPQAGDRFQLEFTINQRSMLYDAGNEVSFQFRPGWFDFAIIKEMKVILDTSALTGMTLDPAPTQTDGKQVIWLTKDMGVNQQTELYTITCTRSSFPGLSETNLSKNASDYIDNTNDYSSYQDTNDGSGVGAAIMVFVFAVVVMLIRIGIKGNSYKSGRYGGGYRGGTFLHGGRPGGGFHGGFGGEAVPVPAPVHVPVPAADVSAVRSVDIRYFIG
jgi:hypothetical protein